MANKKKKKDGSSGQPVGAAEFKAHCLELFDRVRDQGVEYVVTKHGTPVARVVPAAAPTTSLHGAFAGRIRITGDIVQADWHADWEAAR